MTRAAEQLNVAQTALGSQIRQLEEEFGVSLLQRHSRGVSPTAAGELLQRRAQEILALVTQCSREITVHRAEKTESLTIGASGSVVHMAASDLLARAHKTMPNVAINLVEDTSIPLFEALKRGELDMVLAHELPRALNMTYIPWLQEELLFVTAAVPGETRPLSSVQELNENISLAEALQTELTLPVRLDGIRKIIEAAADTLKLKYHVTYKVQSHQALKSLIADNFVASVLPYGLIINELRAGTLRARRIVTPSLLRTLYLARSSYRLMDKNECALLELIESIRLRMIEMLGPLATRLDVEDSPPSTSEKYSLSK
jgi:LysR family nitrogen assimilation transcriptional regulator